MNFSVFDVFRIGIGPSSSHTMGPMTAARLFAESLAERGLLARTHAVEVHLFGSPALTGRGHCADRAILLGLEGLEPASLDPATIDARLARIRGSGRLQLAGRHEIGFDEQTQLLFHRQQVLPAHSNGMRFIARDGEDSEARRLAKGRADLLTPIAKAWASDIGVEMASLAIQVQGGVGYVEETGAAQHLRDARIAPIYEGTNGIQALDLVGRKLQADGGAHWRALLDEMEDFTASSANYVMAKTYLLLKDSVGLLRQAALASQKLADASGDTAFLLTKLATANFFAAEVLPQVAALFRSVTDGGAPLLFQLREEQFAV